MPRYFGKRKRALEKRIIRKRRPPEGPRQLWCLVIEKATGRKVTQALGTATGKYSAQSRARVNALSRLKEILGRRYDLSEYELKYRSAKDRE